MNREPEACSQSWLKEGSWASALAGKGKSPIFREDLSKAMQARTAGEWEARIRETAKDQVIAELTKRNAELEKEIRAEHQRGASFAAISPEVVQLIAGEFDSDGAEELMVAMHRKMASGDLDLAYELEAVAAGKLAPRDAIDARCLALETLATARLPRLEPRLYSLIELCLASGERGLEFGAIGAADLLPQSMRNELSSAVKVAIKRSPKGSSTRRLGALFLENNK